MFGANDDPCATCSAELRRLRAENDELRRSASAFGELAERLHRALIEVTTRASAGGTIDPGRSADEPNNGRSDVG
jgi:hypothetical protein